MARHGYTTCDRTALKNLFFCTIQEGHVPNLVMIGP